MKLLKEVLQEGASRLDGISATPGLDAEVLLRHAGNLSKTELVIQADNEASQELLEKFDQYLERRAQFEPVAYIIGTKQFWDFTVSVSPAVLIPRPETEHLVEEGLVFLHQRTPPLFILDLGTGSGCLAIALARELKKKNRDFSITATDNSEEALIVARKNISDQRLNSVIKLIKSDWFSAIDPEERFDLIVSNPPYVAEGDPRVSPELAFEPAAALYAGAEGFDAIRILMLAAPKYLEPGGCLLFEIGEGQRDMVEAFYKAEEALFSAFKHPRVIKDLSGIDRAVYLQLNS